MWVRIKKKLESLIRFHSANKKTIKTGGGRDGKNFFLNPKEFIEQVKTEE